MPELPEVHTTATILNQLLKNLVVKDAWTDYGGVIHEGKDNIKDADFFKKFKRLIKGAKILNVCRRGKNVLINLNNNQTILVHMKMTGQLLYGRYQKNSETGNLPTWTPLEPEELKDPYSRFVHLVISFTNGWHLALSDVRKFAKVTVLQTKEAHASEHLKDIGPEPLEKNFGFEEFVARLALRPNGRVKQVLMDPKILSGIGNIYSDEILWASKIHPLSIMKKIPKTELRQMFTNMKKILAMGIDFGGDSTSDYRNPYGKRGKFQYHHKAYQRLKEKCLKKGCRGEISKVRLGGRSAHFCPKHQVLYT